MTHTDLLKSNIQAHMRPKKRLGQHFLVKDSIIQEIIGRSGFGASDLIVEIGPGLGALTLPLARSVKQIIAVEKDSNLVDLLKKKLVRTGIQNVTVVNHDILKWDFHQAKPFHSSRLHVIGNLPYNISSPLLKKLVENKMFIDRAVLMLQEEVARRLTASPCEKAYGALTLLIRYHAHTVTLLEVPKEAFYPKPKINSAVVELDFEQQYPDISVREKDFSKVVKGAFAHRRKTILNSLKGSNASFDRATLLYAMKKCTIDPKRRAETLHMDEFLRLASVLSLTKARGKC